MASRRATSPTRAKRGDESTSSVPAGNESANNSASELVESPQKPGRNPLDAHDFAIGGGGGGAESFRRDKTKAGEKR